MYDPSKCDIYALAIVLHSLYFKHLIFDTSNSKQIPHFKAFSRKSLNEAWTILETNEDINGIGFPIIHLLELKELLDKMLCENPDERIDINEVMKSDFYKYLTKSQYKRTKLI